MNYDVVHFFKMEAIPVVDSGSGNAGAISADAGSTPTSTIEAGTVPYTVKMLLRGSSSVANGWQAMPARDMMITVCGRSSQMDSPTNADSGGNISFDMGGASKVKVRPARAGYGTTAYPPVGPDEDHGTVVYPYCPLTIRAMDIDYIFSLVVRGNILEHYVYDDLKGEVVKANAAFDKDMIIRDEVLGSTISCSHVSMRDVDPLNRGTSACETAVLDDLDQAQDYYGMLRIDFPEGAPSEQSVIDSMEYHRAQWPAGNKVVYSDWADVQQSSIAAFTGED